VPVDSCKLPVANCWLQNADFNLLAAAPRPQSAERKTPASVRPVATW